MKNREQLYSDLGLVFFMILSFVTIVVLAGDSAHYIQNPVMLNITFLVILITYFTNLTLAVVINGVVIFGYISYILFLSLVKGDSLTAYSYFWILMIPLFTFGINMITRGTLGLQERVKNLEEENTTLATVDPETGLRNLRTFNNDAKVFMGMACRGKIELTLMLIDFRHFKEISRILGADRLPQFMKKITEVLTHSMRVEDSLYIVDKEDMTFALFLITDDDGSKIVEERIKDRMALEDFRYITAPYEVGIDLRTGDFEYKKGETISPLEFIAKAKKEMEYDVG